MTDTDHTQIQGHTCAYSSTHTNMCAYTHTILSLHTHTDKYRANVGPKTCSLLGHVSKWSVIMAKPDMLELELCLSSCQAGFLLSWNVPRSPWIMSSYWLTEIRMWCERILSKCLSLFAKRRHKKPITEDESQTLSFTAVWAGSWWHNLTLVWKN